MQSLIIFLNHFFDVLWLPLCGTPYYVDILIISALSAVFFLVLFKKTSNQEMIKRYKNRMFAHILEIRLYKDQPVLTLKSIFNIIWYNIIYLRYALPSIIVIFLPLLILCVQINNRYGYRPLEINKPFIIRVHLGHRLAHDIPNILEKIRCYTSGGITLETVPLVVASQASIFWRAKVISSEEDEQFCRIILDGTDDTVEKKVFTGAAKQRFSPERSKWHIRTLLVSNAEDFIPETSPFESVSISYERATYPFLGWNTDLIILYFILTVILGLLFKPLIGVNI